MAAIEATTVELPQAVLMPDEIRAFVSDLAAQPEFWRPHALHDGRRHFANAIGNEFCDVFVISWSEGSDTGFHDHGLASGAVACCLGQVVEERLRIGRENRRTILSAGDAISFDGSHVHRMTDAGTGPAVTIHAYSPRPERIGQFAFEADGTVRRVEISWAAELVNAAAGL